MAIQTIGLSAQVTTTQIQQVISSIWSSAGTQINYTQPTSGVSIGNVGAGMAQYRIDNGEWIVLSREETNFLPVDLSVNRVLVKLANEGIAQTSLDIVVESLPTAYIGPNGEQFPVANPPARINGYRYSGAVATAVPGTGYSYAGGQWYRDGVAISGQTALTYTRVDLDIGKTLSFTPTGMAFSASGGVTLSVPGVPLAPVITAAVGFNTRADVNVRSATGDTADITGFVVTASPGGATATVSGTGPSVVTVTGLANGTVYTFTSKALYAGGEGPVSGTATATPVANRVLHATQGGACTYDGIHASNTYGSIYFETVAAYDMPLGLSLRFANMAVIGANEGGGGGVDTWTGSLELGGTLLQLQKTGASPITVANNTVVETDRVGAGGQIVKGTVLKFRLNTNQAGRIKFFVYGDGDGVMRQKFGTTAGAVPDITMQMDQSSLTIVPSAQQQPLMLPFLIVGEVDGPSLAIKGDSISVARGDYAGSTVGRGYMGREAKALGVAYAQLGKSGDTATAYAGSNTIRRAADAFFTHFENNLGTNDMSSGRTAAQIATDRTTIINHNAGKPQIWFNLIPNVASSSDGYTTVAGQTLRAEEPVRLQVNVDLAAGIANARVVDVNAALAAPGDTSRWNVGPGNVPWTIDGAHPTAAGSIQGTTGYDLSTFIKVPS